MDTTDPGTVLDVCDECVDKARADGYDIVGRAHTFLTALACILFLTGYIIGDLVLASIDDLLARRSQSAVDMMGG